MRLALRTCWQEREKRRVSRRERRWVEFGGYFTGSSKMGPPPGVAWFGVVLATCLLNKQDQVASPGRTFGYGIVAEMHRR